MAFNAADKVNFTTWNQVSFWFWGTGEQGLGEPNPGLGLTVALVLIVTKVSFVSSA
jgi:hypothetical protein